MLSAVPTTSAAAANQRSHQTAQSDVTAPSFQTDADRRIDRLDVTSRWQICCVLFLEIYKSFNQLLSTVRYRRFTINLKSCQKFTKDNTNFFASMFNPLWVDLQIRLVQFDSTILSADGYLGETKYHPSFYRLF